MATTLEINTCLQPTIQRAIKIEILDKNENIINEISGMVIDGNISIDTQSAIRRQCDLRFVLNSTTVISETSSLWINKRFRLYIGIINNLTNEIVWYLQGTFLIFDPTEDIEIDECTVSIKGYDKMAIQKI